jgi:hypothetical protein
LHINPSPLCKNESLDSDPIRIEAQVVFSTSRPVCTSWRAGRAAWAVPAASAAVPPRERPAVAAHARQVAAAPDAGQAERQDAARVEPPDASAAAWPHERREPVSTASTTWSERPDA